MTRFWRIWCRVFHRSTMYAGGDEYQCRRCLEVWPCPWRKA